MQELGLIATAAALLSVAISITACKGETPTGPAAPPTPVGFYTLSTIDGKPMPYRMYADTGFTIDISSGTLLITVAGQWVSKIVSKETVMGTVSTYTDSTYGTWTQPVGSTIVVFLNAETRVTTNGTWTVADATVYEIDGARTHKMLYKRN